MHIMPTKVDVLPAPSFGRACPTIVSSRITGIATMAIGSTTIVPSIELLCSPGLLVRPTQPKNPSGPAPEGFLKS